MLRGVVLRFEVQSEVRQVLSQGQAVVLLERIGKAHFPAC